MKTSEEIRILLGLEPFEEHANRVRKDNLELLKKHYGVEDAKVYYTESMVRRTGRTTRTLIDAISLASAGHTVCLVAPYEAIAQNICTMARRMLEELDMLESCTRNRVECSGKGTIEFLTSDAINRLAVSPSTFVICDSSCYECKSVV